MNFLPIFKYRLKDDLKAVAVFLLVTLLCTVLVIYGVMITVSYTHLLRVLLHPPQKRR